jgi:hypothetical protein
MVSKKPPLPEATVEGVRLEIVCANAQLAKNNPDKEQVKRNDRSILNNDIVSLLSSRIRDTLKLYLATIQYWLNLE